MASTLSVDNIQGATTAANVKMPEGHIVQTVQFLRKGGITADANRPTSSLVAIDSSTFVDVMSKTITTKFANSKIYVSMNCVAYDGASTIRIMTKVLRNSTEINADEYGVYANASQMVNYVVNMIDSPNAAAGTSLTYKLQGARQSGSSTDTTFGYADSGGGGSASIVLMEIAQ
tara:strand:+ start:120 stop:641 length:522 start_codon:yes stop_codon:yes gene_type:complete